MEEAPSGSAASHAASPGRDHDTSARSPRMPVAASLVVVGIGLLTILGSWEGFVGGMVSGAGIALVLLGVAIMGRADRWMWRGDEEWWLPSRDGAIGNERQRDTP